MRFFNHAEYYDRPDDLPVWNLNRHKNIAAGIINIIHNNIADNHINILEVGAGNFQTSLQIYKLQNKYNITALEPYAATNTVPDTITCQISGLSDFGPDIKFDVIFSHHVIEHISDPVNYLTKQATLLHDDGIIIVCCPTQQTISPELMFVDHLFHFTVTGFRHLIKQTQLTLAQQFPAPWDHETHVYILKKDNAFSTVHIEPENTNALYDKRRELISWYPDREKNILNRLKPGERLTLFGAGETSQLIQTYIPELFSRVDALIVTNKAVPRKFRQPIMSIHDALNDQSKITLSVRQKSSPIVEKLLLNSGIASNRIIKLYHSRP